MELKSIKIELAEYGPNIGKFVASCTVKGGKAYPADVTIAIPDEMLEPIVGIMAQAISETMQRSASEFAASVSASLAAPIATKVIGNGVEEPDVDPTKFRSVL